MDITSFTHDDRNYSFYFYEGDYIGEEIKRRGTFYALHELNIIKPTLKPEFTVIDCGANIGNHSVFFSRFCKKIYAIEPHPELYKLLEINTSANADNIVCMNYLLSDNKYRYKQKEDKRNLGHTIYHRGDGDILSVRLDDLFTGQKIDFIKIDTEGMEADVLEGAAKILKMYHPKLFIEVHGSVENQEKVQSILKKYNYKNGFKKILEHGE